MSWLQRSIPAIAEAVQNGDVTATELTESALARMAEQDELGAFLTVGGETALAAAKRVDEKRSAGDPLGPLAGVPIAVKDALCTRDLPTTAASRILDAATHDGALPVRPYQPPYDATAVARLRDADAVVVGKCNMDEFAMGSSNENSGFAIARNPWNRERAPGGSSGGSAVAVAAAMAPGALGTDTGGSVRQPAGFCGTVGVKPSYGRVSRYGLIAFASSLDQIGPLATDVRGAAQLLEVIAGHDAHDSTSLEADVPGMVAACGAGVEGLTIGIPEEYFGDGLDAAVEERVRAGIKALEDAGATMKPVSLPHTKHAVATYYVIATAECSSNLARFDGVRYGLRERADNLDEMYRVTRSRGFGAEVKRRIMLGTYVLSAGYYDAYYLRAQRVRTLIRRDFDAVFSDCDLLATPVSPTVAFELGSRTADPLSMYLADIYTLPASLAGLAALSVPCGLAHDMPVGLQLIAPPLGEVPMFRAGGVVETALGTLTCRMAS
jgi:aspartyl-tRNA(Asn)/glutamyl-tRNA(Gln) amidotransferase subunit A